MKRFSAQYIFTNTGPALKRGIVTVGDDGTVTDVADTGGELMEKHSLEFHNGIIIPGFVNCHCHLELSHMKGAVKGGEGLTRFIEAVRNTRSSGTDAIIASAKGADRDMYSAGINLCADICNTSHTFQLKTESRISYINLLEVFGIDPAKAGRRMDEISSVAIVAEEKNLPWSLVPHSAYSLSRTLFRLLGKKTEYNAVTSMHFMESRDEAELLEHHSGPLMESYLISGLISSDPETVKSHPDAVLDYVTGSGNLILVHNTFTDRNTIRKISSRENLYWCLCPGSNLYIENQIPPAGLLSEEGCNMVIGTDSLASNTRLSILEELKILQSHFPFLSLDELIKWGTLNGAKALGMEESFGTIAPGKQPGLLLLGNIDLANMKLTPESYVTRLA